jgi:mRNA interferase HigB
VRIIGRDTLDGFARRHPTARAPLEAWVLLIGNKSFRHFPDLKHVFPKADYVKPRTVFNIGGNKYRLNTTVDYGLQSVVIKEVLTHEEYDREGWKK